MTDPNRSGNVPEETALWRLMATGWERHADFIARVNAPVQEWLVDRLDPRPGETFLEMGAGPGDLGFEIAGRLGADGRLISTDVSSEMLDVTRRRATKKGVTNVDFGVMDAQKLELDDASVDGAAFRFGPMLLPDPAAHAREVRRVLRPGGRYACAVFAGPERNGWMTIQMMSFVQSGFQPPGGPTDPGSPFSLSDPEALRSLWQDAGFDDVTIETLDVPFELASFDELWALPTELAGPVAVAVGRLSDDERERFRETLKTNAENFRSGEGYVLPGAAHCALVR